MKWWNQANILPTCSTPTSPTQVWYLLSEGALHSAHITQITIPSRSARQGGFVFIPSLVKIYAVTDTGTDILTKGANYNCIVLLYLHHVYWVKYL